MSDPLEKTASAHESLSALLHAIDPRVLIRIACAAAGIDAGEHLELRYRNPRSEVPASSKRALGLIVDLVYTVHDAHGQVVGFWILEIELTFTLEKIWRWSLYEIALDAEYRTHGRVAVFSPKPRLREDVRSKVLPRMKTEPVLVEPDQIERITDYQDARRRPELTILGCLFHAQEPAAFEDRVEVFRAAWVALQSVAELDAQRYHVVLMRTVAPKVIDQGISELREAGDLDEARWEKFSDSERGGWSFQKGYEEGQEAGRQEGRRDLLRRALVDVLELRGFALTPEQRERIESCEALEILERWYATAKTVTVDHGVEQLLR